MATPDSSENPAREKPSLADRHWRATLRSRSRDDLESDMLEAIEKNNMWRFGMLMQLDAGWARNDSMLRAAIEHDRTDMFTAMTAKDPGWQDSANLNRLGEQAAESGRLGILQLFIEKYELDVHFYSDELLRTAVKNDHTDVVRYLVSKGADVTVWNNDPIRDAADKGNLDIVKILVEAGADVNASNGDPLTKAAAAKSVPVVEYLLEKGAKPEEDNYRAFISAAREGSLEILQLFIDRKVSANVQDGEALIEAVSNKHIAAAELLLLQGADINAQHGKALRNAAYRGEMDTAKFLLEHRANPNVADRLETPLTEAVRTNNADMVLLLMRHGADYAQLQYEAWKVARRDHKGMVRAIVKGDRERLARVRNEKFAEFAETFPGKYTLDDLRTKKGPSGDTGLLIAAQTGKFSDLVGKAEGGKLTGDDLYHPEDRIDTVLYMLVRHKSLQQFFHPGFWADRAYEVKEVHEQLPERYQRRVQLGSIANEINYRMLKKKAMQNGGNGLKPAKALPPAPKLPPPGPR